MKDKFYERLKHTMRDLNQVKQDHAHLRREIGGAQASVAPGSNGPAARQLHQALHAIQLAHDNLAHHRAALRDQPPALSQGWLGKLRPVAAAREQVHWLRLYREAGELTQAVTELQQQVHTLQEAWPDLRPQPPLTVSYCREVQWMGEQALELGAELEQVGLYGPEFEGVLAALRELTAAARDRLAELERPPEPAAPVVDGEPPAPVPDPAHPITAGQMAIQIEAPLRAHLALLGRWRTAHQQLCTALDDLRAHLYQIRTEMRAAEGGPDQPLEWGRYQTQWQELSQLAASLGGPTEPRTPPDLVQQASQVREWQAQAQQLDAAVEEAQALRQRLIAYLDRADLPADPAWLTDVELLQRQIERHPPANWPADLEVQTYAGDARGLAQRVQFWVPAGADAPLLAPRLKQQWAEVRGLATEMAAFHVRRRRIVVALAEIERKERAMQQMLAQHQQTVQRLIEAMDGAQPPLESDLRRARAGVIAAGQELAQLADDVARSAEPAGAQRRAVQQRIEVHHQALMTFWSLARQEMDRYRADLQREVDCLRAVAPFDREPVMIAAAQLLATGAGEPAADRDPEAPLQRRTELYLALEAIRTQIEDPLSESCQALKHARDMAHRAFEDLIHACEAAETCDGVVPCDLTPVRRMLDAAADEERHLQTVGPTVREVQAALGRLARQYLDAHREIARQRILLLGC
ncbi:MAG: hypothetical protein PVH11_10140 [Anaerolineae bacterium]|jgi:hypothetical protein